MARVEAGLRVRGRGRVRVRLRVRLWLQLGLFELLYLCLQAVNFCGRRPLHSNPSPK